MFRPIMRQFFRSGLFLAAVLCFGWLSMASHTMVLYGCHMGDANLHNNLIILAGGGFRHGQHLAFNPHNNTPLCNVFVSMLQRMQIELDQFSSSTGTLTGLA